MAISTSNLATLESVSLWLIPFSFISMKCLQCVLHENNGCGCYKGHSKEAKSFLCLWILVFRTTLLLGAPLCLSWCYVVSQVHTRNLEFHSTQACRGNAKFCVVRAPRWTRPCQKCYVVTSLVHISCSFFLPPSTLFFLGCCHVVWALQRNLKFCPA